MARGFLQISFAWLFGIIAGAIILGLAIFFATKIVSTGQYQSSAEVQKEISVLLNPLETGFQSGQVTTLTLAAPTRINVSCDNSGGEFGRQIIRTSQQSFGKWSTQTPGISVQSKYLFSEGVPEGKNFYLFSKPLNFPFKVADLIYITSDSENYCFINTPNNISEELTNLKEPNIKALNEVDCPSNSIKVCFYPGGDSCSSANTTVYYSLGQISKSNGEKFTFSGDALMYAAIFSDSKTYGCQIQRLMKREAQLADIYSSKLDLIKSYGCSSGMASDLSSLKSYARSTGDSGAIINSVAGISDKLSRENEIADCRLW